MVCIPTRYRVVIVGEGEVAANLAALFASDSTLHAWEATLAESVEHARFFVQLQACHVLLVDRSALGPLAENVLGWLSASATIPVIFLSQADPDLLQHGLARGVHLWLPRDLVLQQPAVLAEALHHARRSRQHPTDTLSAADEAGDCHARIERLADLLWNALPVEGRPGWLSQRFLLERLHEEVVRSDRHGTPLTLVLAELALESDEKPQPGGMEQAVRAWTAERILRGKRRSDVAGQYGDRCFLLLLPHTSTDGAGEVCRRLRRDIGQAPWRLHASFGVASYSSSHRTPTSLLRLAEEGLESGVRSQESGVRNQESGDRSQESGKTEHPSLALGAGILSCLTPDS